MDVRPGPKGPADSLDNAGSRRMSRALNLQDDLGRDRGRARGRGRPDDEEMAKYFYRIGFRSLDEVAEAPDAELQSIHGIDTPERAAEIRAEARRAMETLRLERIANAKARPELLAEREHLLLCRGVTERILEMLEHAGYRSVQDIMREGDVDRLAIRTGLGNQKAREIKEGVAAYLDGEMESVKSAQREARARWEAEQAERGPEAEQAPGEGEGQES